MTFFDLMRSGRWRDPTDLAFIRRFLDTETANNYDPKVVYTKEEVGDNSEMTVSALLSGSCFVRELFLDVGPASIRPLNVKVYPWISVDFRNVTPNSATLHWVSPDPYPTVPKLSSP